MRFLGTTDDARNAVQLHPAGIGLAARGAVPRRGGLLRTVRAGVVRLVLSPRTLMFVGAAALITTLLMVFWGGGLAALYLLLFSPVFGSLALAFAGGVIGAGLLGEGVKRRAIRAMLLRRRCPQCGYGLAGTPEQGGQVTCPECGAVWSARRLGTDQEPPPTVYVITTGNPRAGDAGMMGEGGSPRRP